MKVTVLNRQKRVRVSPPRVRAAAEWLLTKAAQPGKPRRWTDVVLVLTDDRGIRPVNSACFARNEPTDVISLAYPAIPGERGDGSVEVFVNAQRAAQIAGRGLPFARELLLYAAHGFHHLYGASDRTAALRARMIREEDKWVKTAERKGLLRGLCR